MKDNNNLLKRVSITIKGAVQGVGFRPFIYRFATGLNLKGWVLNSSEGVFIEAEGNENSLEKFILNIEKEKPPLSHIYSFEYRFLDPIGYDKFEIRKSDTKGETSALILPDIATCPDCLSDLFDVNNRRYLYPFTNCTNCGPRFTIIESLPYDRQRTSMKNFIMCKECREEYEDPLNRRFHAQPNACPVCGPYVELYDSRKKLLSSKNEAVIQCAESVLNGKIIALMGLGGFHIICDAENKEAIKKLRLKKNREEKPFALMYPDMDKIKTDCYVNPFEERVLKSQESPIVLLLRKDEFKDDNLIAPENPYFGIILPYTPLHHILLHYIKKPIIATSGNFSEEPICISPDEAFNKLGEIADIFLIHNRPILRHCDDSIVRVVMNRELVLRRARGYAPLPIRLTEERKGKEFFSHDSISVGAHLKNTVAVSKGQNVFISQHIGNLETEEAYNSFIKAIEDLKKIYEINADKIYCDMHPDYLSTKYAVTTGRNVTEVQHHIAHILSCMAENQLSPPVLGVSWDGTGYGQDGKIWGGEFFKFSTKKIDRIAHFRYFPLPGGESAIKYINRISAGILYTMYCKGIIEDKKCHNLISINGTELKTLIDMIDKKINSPLTSSVGRIFDSVASLIGLTNTVNYEGQAAMNLEFLTINTDTDDKYECEINKGVDIHYIIDWEPMFKELLSDISNMISKNIIAVKFHNTLANVILEIVKKVNLDRILLSGGCFQNKYLLEKSIKILSNNGFNVYWHQRIPPNDGGISLGQIVNNYYY